MNDEDLPNERILYGVGVLQSYGNKGKVNGNRVGNGDGDHDEIVQVDN